MKNNSLLSHRSQEPQSSILYLVGTPIGNLNDISPRAINILKNVSYIACEDTRETKKIMSKFNISNNLLTNQDDVYPNEETLPISHQQLQPEPGAGNHEMRPCESFC